ncbi:4-hydroxy-tetrahydrodipicolinate synthase [Actinomycetospora sp. NBRC 106378]|uniref:4-hydroxy-tetrahydrodipicolinate synthase n=1 Tax=Actinomycetospora sp. NBRC 106378 TaxID=3032208 RepID=UPI0024A39870|nr:4-hydroxy-tetrahydrodipicolinate synthase [Actinomycetospora sp. NBRC 106378]GLZ51919.1 4-hydroxy-tetrahydrodipicolinate synthase [Actinomycetospora sp. NBRC 106378]
MVDLDGLWVPLVTPFTQRDEVDLDALRRLATEVLDDGARGLVALGTTGEPTSLTPEERRAVVAVCAEVAGDRGAGLVVAAGTNDTRSTLARHAALADVPGVTAALTVVPYYVRPGEPAVVAHLTHVAERSPVPLVVYNVPARTGLGLGAAALLDLAGHPQVVGLKQAVGALDLDTATVLAAAPPDLAVLAGDDPFIAPTVLLGGRGAIAASSHVATDRFAALVADGLAGRTEAARAHHTALLPVVSALFAEPNPVVVKALLHAAGRIATPDVRMPLAPASPPALARAVAALGAVRAPSAGPRA